MADPSPGPFKVHFSEHVRQEIARLGQKAGALGIDALYFRALREMAEHLEHDPLTWGEKQNHLATLGLDKYHRVQGPLSISSGVDNARRLVYLLEVRPLPSHPLGQGG